MAAGLGGDYFDFIRMADGCQTLFIGDVTGHGLHASVVMSLIYGYMHRAASEECAPLPVVQGINALLRGFASRSKRLDHFFSTTLFFAIIDPGSLRMDYINCGHTVPLIRRGKRLSLLETTASPLGFFAAPEIGLGHFEFQQGDRMLLYTDGISEATNPQGEVFGRGGLESALMSLNDDYMEFLEQIFGRMQEFGCPTPPRDDCTAIVLDFHSPLPGAR